MPKQVPLVDYLVLGDDPHLVAQECTDCGARYFDRRNACATCAGHRVRRAGVANEGDAPHLHHRGLWPRPGIPVPFVAGVIDCDGTRVRANVVNVDADPEHVVHRHEGPPDHVSDRYRRRRRRGHRLRLRAGRLNAAGRPTPRGGAIMADDVWILGIHMTKFGKHPDKDTVDLAAEAAIGALADGGVTMKDIGVLGCREPHGRVGRHRPAAAEADRPDRHPGLQRGQRLRHRGHRPAGGGHGGQGRERSTSAWPSASRSWPAPGCWPAAAGGRTPTRWTPKGRYGAVAALDGRIGTDDHARRLRPDRHGVRAQVRRDDLRAVRQDQREEPRPLDAQPDGRLPEEDERWRRS